MSKWHIAPEEWSAPESASQDARIPQKPIGVSSDYSAAVFAIGIHLFESGQFLDAARQFRTLLRLRPDFTQAQKYLDHCLANSRKLLTYGRSD